MELISPTDLIFLLGESREHAMHVGGLALYKIPDGAGPEFVREVYQEVGEIIVADVNKERIKHLLDPDRVALSALIAEH